MAQRGTSQKRKGWERLCSGGKEKVFWGAERSQSSRQKAAGRVGGQRAPPPRHEAATGSLGLVRPQRDTAKSTWVDARPSTRTCRGTFPGRALI